MAATGKKKSAEQKQAEQNVDQVAASSPASTLGTAGNPIKGPPLQDFTRGPEINYTVPQHRVDAGEAQLGTQANPIVGPAIGSSPGVQNPGEMTITGPASPQAVADATALSDDQTTMHNMRMRAAHSTTSAAGANTPATLVTKDEEGNQVNQTIVPRAGETAEDAVRRIQRDGGDTEPLKEETAVTELQQKHAKEQAELTQKHQEARTKLGEKHTKANDASREAGTKLADKHREALEKNPGDNATITKNSTERQEFDAKATEAQTKQQEEFTKLQETEQKELTELQEKQAKELADAQSKLSDAQAKEREKAASNDGPTHRRAGTTHKQTGGKKADDK